MIRQDGNKVWVAYTRKINIGNYENIDISAGLTIDLEEGEPLDAQIIKVATEVRKAHNRIVARAEKDNR